MPFKERFENYETQDPRIVVLNSVKNNYEFFGPSGTSEIVLELGYFEMLKELLELYPNADNYSPGFEDSIPGLCFNEENVSYFFELTDPGGGAGNELTVKMSSHSVTDSSGIRELAQEYYIKDELSRDVLEDSIVRIFIQSGFRSGETIQKDTKAEEKVRSADEEYDSIYRYHRTLKLDPNAFKDLSKEEGDQLLRSVYRFAIMKYHPDRGGDDESMKLRNEAKEILDDPKNRNPDQ